MITSTGDLKKRINAKIPKIIVSKALLSKNKSNDANAPWVDVGFAGLAGIISTASLFLMSFLSQKWKAAYVQKKLYYRYSAILEDEDTVTFNLKK